MTAQPDTHEQSTPAEMTVRHHVGGLLGQWRLGYLLTEVRPSSHHFHYEADHKSHLVSIKLTCLAARDNEILKEGKSTDDFDELIVRLHIKATWDGFHRTRGHRSNFGQGGAPDRYWNWYMAIEQGRGCLPVHHQPVGHDGSVTWRLSRLELPRLDRIAVVEPAELIVLRASGKVK